MSNKDNHSVTINIPRPIVLNKKSICDNKKVTKNRTSENAIRKPSEVSLRKYSLPDNSPLKVNSFEKEYFLLPYRLYAKKQESIKRKQRLGIRLDEKYKVINTELRKRLHVEDPPDDVRAVTDIDDSFFEYMSGHPLTQYSPLYKSLKFPFYKYLKSRQEVGYRQDYVLHNEENHRKELQIYERSVQKYMTQVKNLGAFVSADYQKSMACLRKSENIVADVEAKQLELECLAHIQFKTQSKLIGLNYMYYQQQKYGRFLYYLSPPGWRARHRDFARSVEIEVKGFDLGTSSEEDTFNIIFEKLQNECFSGLVKPALYFSQAQPNGLLSVFEGVEKQQLYHFTHVNHLRPHAKMLKKVIVNLKSNIKKDSEFVAEIINDIEKLLDFHDERGLHLQDLFLKILNGLFYESVAAVDVLKLQQHLEFYYEKLYAEKSTNMTLLSLAKALEDMYMKYSFKLDEHNSDKIAVVLKQCIKEDNKKINRAYAAARELRLFDRLEHALIRAYGKGNTNEEFPLLTVKQPSNRKLKNHQPKPVVRRSSQRELTDAEIEYLSLFTNWNDTKNPAKYMNSL